MFNKFEKKPMTKTPVAEASTPAPKTFSDKTNSTVYISNLSYKRDKQGLTNLFTRYGAIKNIKIVIEPRTGQSRGMAFVEMGNEKQAQAAIDGINQQVFDGRTVKASYATPLRAKSVSRYDKEETEPVKEGFRSKKRTEKSKFRQFVESRKMAKA